MTWLGTLLRLFGGNAIPGGGFLVAGWSPATALTLYWIDNLIGSIATGIRIVLHRRWTGASGHARGQLGATYRTGKYAPERSFKSFLAEFVVTSLAFSLVQGVFLAFFLTGILDAVPNRDHVRQGASAVLVAHLLALAVDARRLPTWPFAQLRDQAQRMLGRVLLVHLAILGGMMFLAARGTPDAFFSIFIALKFLADLGTLMPRYEPGDRPPRLLVWLMGFFPKQNGESFEDYWRRTRATEAAQFAQDEQPSGSSDAPSVAPALDPSPVPDPRPQRGKAKRRRA